MGKSTDEDRAARGLNEEQIAADTKALLDDYKTVMLGEMRGAYAEEGERCRLALIPQEIDGRVTTMKTEALDPADFGTASFYPETPMIDDNTLELCLGEAEMVRAMLGVAALDKGTRFYRLRRERDPATYDQAIAAAYAAASTRISTDLGTPSVDGPGKTMEEARARSNTMKDRWAQRTKLCASYDGP